MDSIAEFILQHAHVAHWFVFGAIILAGMNIPISADLMLILSAVLAATIVPEHTVHLFLAVLLGCYFSAMVAYWIGRLVGPKLSSIPWFSKVLNKERLLKVRGFYENHGLSTLIIGRFIPFGVRNCIFMSTGMTKMHFGKFILKDALACSIWSGTTFYVFYILGQNYQVLYHYAKTFNLLIFSAFSVTVIGIIWYKRKKRPRLPD